VHHNEDDNNLEIANLEKDLRKILYERVERKSEIIIGKVQKKLF